jgi:hypothetical protein
LKRFAATICLISLLLGLKAFADGLFQIHDVGDGSEPCVAVDKKGHLHLAFQTHIPLNLLDIFYAKSTDGAQTWTTPVDISVPGRSEIADIVVDPKGIIDVAFGYTEFDRNSAEIYLARSTDGGKTWAQPFNISKTLGVSSEPDVAVGPDGSIHVAWTDTSAGGQHPQIYYCASKDGGVTWSTAENISNTSGAAGEPAIAVGDDGCVFIAWAETASGANHPDIFFARKTSGVWVSSINVSSSLYATSHPDIACGPKGTIYLCWAERSGVGDAQHISYRAANRHADFRTALNLSDTGGVSSHPALVADDRGRVAVVWANTQGGGAKSKIFGRASLDGGKEFSMPISFSSDEANSINPDVDIWGDKLFVVWEDSSAGKSTIKSTSVEIKLASPTGP